MKKEKNISYTFGPVNSRRFGLSLGVDLSSGTKQCNFDCLYCELEPSKTISSQVDFAPVKDIVEDVKKHLSDDIDVITLTANGEPTLYPYLDELIDAIDAIKGNTKTLILTNSAMLGNDKVFNSLLKLDSVKLSLDAISSEIFKKIDRPHKDIDIASIPKNIARFSKVYGGELFLEVLFIKGVNNKKDEVLKLNDFFKTLHAKRIDLSSIDRPPAYDVKGLDFEELYELSLLFDASLPIHIASRKTLHVKSRNFSKDEILNTLKKRPLTENDINVLFDKESKKVFLDMLNSGDIVEKHISKLIFFAPAEQSN